MSLRLGGPVLLLDSAGLLGSTGGDVPCSSLPIFVTPVSRGSHYHISSQAHSPSQMHRHDHSSLHCLITNVSVSGSGDLAVALNPPCHSYLHEGRVISYLPMRTS